jgi:hypothetical protein
MQALFASTLPIIMTDRLGRDLYSGAAENVVAGRLLYPEEIIFGECVGYSPAVFHNSTFSGQAYCRQAWEDQS